MKDLRIKTKLTAGLGAIVALLLVLLAIAYNNFNRLSEANEWDRHTREVLQETNLIAVAVLQIQNSTRGFMLTGNESLVENIPREEEAMRTHHANLVRLTSDNAEQQKRLQKMGPLMVDWVQNIIKPLLEKRRELNKKVGVSQQVATAADVLNGAQIIAEVRKLITEMNAEENRLLVLRAAATQELHQTQKWLLGGGGVLVAVLAAIIGWQLGRALLEPLNTLLQAVSRIAAGEQSARVQVTSNDELGQVGNAFNHMAQAIQDNLQREVAASNELRTKVDALLGTVSKATAGDLTGKITVSGDDAIGRLGNGLATMFTNLRALINNVQKAGIQVTTSATEIAASAKQQEATGVEQAQTSIEVLSTTKEISANTQQLLKTMEDATAVADYTTSATAEAQDNLQRMDQTMQHMVSATDSINAKLAALSEKASNINSVLATITKVADQTNILSLNAAIEAEKAGEAGRGFSVVATEIRRLADQTSVSTWDIEQMLKEMQSAVSASVMGMDKFSEEIRRSVTEVRQVVEQLSGVMGQVQKLAPQFDAVLQGMQSQSVGAQQISETMMQLNDATQQTVDSLKSTSEAVRQLQFAAGDLQSSVATFAINT
ncbi:HAMP domain-containing protein [Duganella sp. FT92W]|uniref:HAMP domain-containing protein n=1 Tax=Pseudoduganella rivuli TaxID=2666085 RepID=A0A7X2ILY4_9BURK|nr:methyl-accepting chemotaxis protein [Pseudoduganella rivuli]MRV72456.1 HAMP domain-containing protein [Pseudoduganella rivuli]